MSAHKGNTVNVVRTSVAGDPGLPTGANPANCKLVQLPPFSPIVSSSLVSTAVMPVPDEGLCYTAVTTEII